MAFLVETAVQLEERNLAFAMTWVTREQNVEADAITNGSYDWRNPKNRIHTTLDRLPFKVLHTLHWPKVNISTRAWATSAKRPFQ